MNAKNCPSCGKIFMDNAFGICDSCRTAQEQNFRDIKDYVDENRNCTLGELSDATGVSIKRILGYIREGRLMATSGMAGEVTCKSCGAPVAFGNFCDACNQKLSSDIKDIFGSQPSDPKSLGDGTRMHLGRRIK
jgi:predicted amidophosphoribosyltransferase